MDLYNPSQNSDKQPVIQINGLNARRAKNPLAMQCGSGKLNHYPIRWGTVWVLPPILDASGLLKAQVFTFAVSQFGMFRGRFGNFEKDCALNMTDRRRGEE